MPPKTWSSTTAAPPVVGPAPSHPRPSALASGAPKARARAFKTTDKDKLDAGPGREALAVIAPKGLGQEGSTREVSVGRGYRPSAAGKAGLSTKSSVGARPVYGTGPGGKNQHQGGGGSMWQQMNGASTEKGMLDGESTRGGRFAKEDVMGTNRAIQDEWKRGKKTKDVLAACARINSFLDNPLFASDEDRAAVTVQRVFRGWILRVSRQHGTVLFPVEAQTLADSRVLMHNEYGARIYSMSPPERRRLVCEHFSAKQLQRVWRRHRPAGGAQLKPEESCILVAPEDSLLMVPDVDFACSEQHAALAAVQLLQRAVRCRRARKHCKRMRLRLSKAVNFLRFLSSELGNATKLDAVRIRSAAALRMQACWRGVCCRSQLKGSVKSRAYAVTTLQKTVRGWSSRRQLDRLLDRLLLKRALRWWNKIMWTVYSPGKTAQDAAAEAGRFSMENGVAPIVEERCEEDSTVLCTDAGERAESADKGAQQEGTPREELEVSPTPPTAIRPSKIGAYKSGGGLEDEDEDGGIKRSLWVEREEGDTVMLDAQQTPRQHDLHAENDILRQAAQETPRQSWQVVEQLEERTRVTSIKLSCKAQVGESASETVGKGGGADEATTDGATPVNSTQWPESYSSSMCFEPGALKQAIVTDSSAVRIQRAVRAYMASRFGSRASAPTKALRPIGSQQHKHVESTTTPETPVQKGKGKSGSNALDGAHTIHVTPPAGGQGFFGGNHASAAAGGAGVGLGLPPTPYRTGRSPSQGSLMSPVRKTPPGGASGWPPMTPVNGGVCGVEREQVLSAWKKGIEHQVSIIHEQLIDSARKCSARSRSRSPPPGSVEKQLLFDANGRASPSLSEHSSPGASPAFRFKDDADPPPHPLVPSLLLYHGEGATNDRARSSHDAGEDVVAWAHVETGRDATSSLASLNRSRESPARGSVAKYNGGGGTPGKLLAREARGLSPSRPSDRIESRNGTGGSRAATRSPYEASPGRLGSNATGGKDRDRKAPSPARGGTRGPSPGGVTGGRTRAAAGTQAGSGSVVAVGQQSCKIRRGGGLQHGGAAGGSVKMAALPSLPSPV